ncbi:SCO family protein [Ectobacillus antri]|jgi:protein SCO1/2|uniref:SCO family protein n=1 Tax=Ectobacillus antri TaxID=2486280 RepID=A0ABT6H355_9BACI|nr:SCO family protein [Ectobacillus antri]MDG4656360.1 SCO family protein [Ectobacillus antri]MDG5753035.1 SCO family protein [Ectobacillus antri]
MMRTRILGVLAILLVITGCTGAKIRDPLNWKTESFQYINQEGKPFGSKDLKGKVWIASFIFTSCTTVCPPMTANVARLQKMTAEKNLDVEFVSFSVDPTVDTPEAMRSFGDKFAADYSNWNFLTGYTQQEIESFAKKNFQSFIKKPEGEDQVIHQTSFFLVSDGVVMKKYSAVENTPYEEILRDIERLTQ